MKTLIITDSYDATTDLLVLNIGSEHIVRLNFDLHNESSIQISPFGISIELNGLVISDQEISKVLWRKPFNSFLEVDKYIESELKYIYREIFNYFSLQNKTILVVPNIERYMGKIIQLTIAKTFFQVPSWRVCINENLGEGEGVAKSLSTSVTNDNKIVYTTIIKLEDLDRKYPWFVQELVVATVDVTVVYIDGKLFAYELDRVSGLVDWRKEINRGEQKWRIHKLNDSIAAMIIDYMNTLGLKYGRLDFLFDSKTYHFLEVNPNGQWAWLDIENNNGLMAEMIRQVSPNTSSKALVKSIGY